jgi:anti-sigma B factor antagonist
VSQAPLEIDSACAGESGRVTLSGELDLATVARVEQAVDAALAKGVRKLVIDLARVGFVDSSGLRLFIVLDQRAASEGWKLSLTRPPERVMTVFRVSGVEDTLPFADDRARA